MDASERDVPRTTRPDDPVKQEDGEDARPAVEEGRDIEKEDDHQDGHDHETHEDEEGEGQEGEDEDNDDDDEEFHGILKSQKPCTIHGWTCQKIPVVEWVILM